MSDPVFQVPTSKEEAAAVIEQMKSEIDTRLGVCTELANKFDIGFSMDIAYGMGGYYDPEEKEWCPSSMGC